VSAAPPGTMLEVGVRATRVPADVVPLPFYKRGTAAHPSRPAPG